MASISTDSKGNRRILFIADGQRKAVRLGRVSMKQAEFARLRIEQLLAGKNSGTLDEEAAKWLGTVDDRMHARLARAGLVAPRSVAYATLGTLLDAFVKVLDVKPGTMKTLLQTRKSLEAHFGTTKAVREINQQECEAWRTSMVDAGLAPATVSKRVKTARQIFRKAGRWGMLRRENPFAEVRAGAQTNTARMHFVSIDDARKVLDACPDAEWRALVALSRWGGLRCPSEVAALRWGDVQWDTSRIMVRSPKTEGIEGRGVRPVPLYPELRAALMAAFEVAAPGSLFVASTLRGHANLSVAFRRIIVRAGLKVWPKPFHAMRSSRQTELSEDNPAASVAAWQGNSLAVAQAHYLQVRDAHFERAATTRTLDRDARHVASEKPTQNPVHFPAQQASVRVGMARKPEGENAGFGLDVPTDSELCGSVPCEPMTPRGFEPLLPG